MALSFDPGYVAEPFLTLAGEPPGEDVYPPAAFRVEWGPVFHRGRLDGTARLLVIGQDPATHETICRRVLVGTAGRRVQGFLARLGLPREYVVLNAYLYSVYGQHGGERHIRDAAIAEHRHRWLDAVTATSPIAGVVTFGHLATKAFAAWPGGSALPHAAAIHPTYPDSFARSGGEGTAAERRATAMRALCESWNAALDVLAPALGASPPPPYGEALTDGDESPIPSYDLPAGTPAWMYSGASWAVRRGEDAERKRATIVVTVPRAARTWE